MYALILTQFTAVGGQVGPETQRAFRTSEAFELAELCRASAERGRHVFCVGDLNSLPESLCMSLLYGLAGLQDSFAAVTQRDPESPDAGITCDSPRNTWTAHKTLDERAVRHNGKRLDYILFRGPAQVTSQLQCTEHQVVLTEPILAYGVSYSDHFGVEATFATNGSEVVPTKDAAADVLGRALPVLRDALVHAHASQRVSLRWFVGLLGVAVALVAANVCSSAWLVHGRSVAPSLITALLLIPTAWAGTTALYDGIVWGEWHKRMLSI